MKSILLVMFLGISDLAFSQADTATYGYFNGTFIQAEIVRDYPGGNSVWKMFLKRNLIYPTWAEQENITGKVTVAFTVNLGGKTSNYEVVKSLNPQLDEEALRVVKKSGVWTLVVNLGKQVIYRNRIDLMFPLENAN